MGGVFAFLAAIFGPVMKLLGYSKTTLSPEAQAAAAAAKATTENLAQKENAVVHQQVAQAARDFDQSVGDDPDSLWNDDGHQVHSRD